MMRMNIWRVAKYELARYDGSYHASPLTNRELFAPLGLHR
jgi:hypothetical protein